MKPPTRDEIRTLLTVAARGEGVTIDIDEIAVELITRAIESNPLCIASLGEEHSLTIVAVAVQAFMFGMSSTAARLSDWLATRDDLGWTAAWREFDKRTTDHHFCAWIAVEIERMRNMQRPFPPLRRDVPR